MPWISGAIAAGGSIAGGLLGAAGADKAADAQKKSAAQQLALQGQMYYANLGINEPWRYTGFNALNDINSFFGYQTQPYQSATDIARQADVGGGPGAKLGAKAVAKMLKRGMSIEDISKLGRLKDKSKVVNKLSKYGLTADQIKTLQGGPMGLGLPAASYGGSGGAAPDRPATPDWDAFLNSPDYQWRVSEGLRDIGNSFSARGGAFGGNALKGITDWGQRMASQEADKYLDRRMSLAIPGYQASQQAGQYGQNFANQGSQAIGAAGDARASGLANQYNMWGQGIQGAANAFGNYWDNRQSAPPTSGYGYYTGGA